ncbi:MAG: pre-mRNA processing RNA-helicase [Bogoriella megaspora]|nr:MAG: pre-mRNA processing RNA-helicase [Bogoriella megaspora]
MARRADARSPPPDSSSHGRHSRREDDRHDRDRRGERSHRYRSRSPVRHRDDRNYSRRDRSPDRSYGRREDDSYRSGRRERSRDRFRERSPLTDRRRRSPDRDHRDRRDDSRDRKRRRERSTDSSRKAKRDDSRDRPSKASNAKDLSVSSASIQDSAQLTELEKPASSPAPKDGDTKKKLAERLNKLEALKAQAAAQQKTINGTPVAPEETEKKQANSPKVEKPASPADPVYAGPFDPKAIAKKAKGKNSGSNAAVPLGADVAIPEQLRMSSTKVAQPSAPKLAQPTAGPGARAGGPSKPLKASLGFNKVQADTKIDAGKKTLELGEEEVGIRKLEKLPDLADDDQGQLDDVQMEDEEADAENDTAIEEYTEEQALAVAREAAEKREERLQEEDKKEMTNGEVIGNGINGGGDDEIEIDPLDAYMNSLAQTSNPVRGSTKRFAKAKQTEPEAMFSDDENAGLEVVKEDLNALVANAAKKKKKELPKVDHSKMNYQPFRKAFYQQPAEFNALTEDQVAQLRAEKDNIKVRGTDPPRPVSNFSQCALDVATLGVLEQSGFEDPTAIQSQAIPTIMSGRDLIGIAKTGSGKTLAFLLPMFRHIKDQPPPSQLDGPIGLILTPTRELAIQIHKDIGKFSNKLNLRSICAYGGAPISDHIADCKRGGHVIVATPGRLIDLLIVNSGRATNLKRVSYVVLDEADRMLDMGFEPQIRRIVDNIRPDKQMVLFSATFNAPMEALARKFLNKPVEIVVGGKSTVAPEITQVVEVREEETKFTRTLELLSKITQYDEDARVLIFTERQESADSLVARLLKSGYSCTSTHGGKNQDDRDDAISDFKSGAVPILTATSVAARGLDIRQLKLVIQYDCPHNIEDYVHRCGRTGRAGNTGIAVTFITPKEGQYAVGITKALKQSGKPVPKSVSQLADDFMEKVNKGEAKALGISSGFGGRGLAQLDKERNAARNRERKAYNTGDEPDEQEQEQEGEGDQGLEIAFTAVKASGAAPAPSTNVDAGFDINQEIIIRKREEPGPAGTTDQSLNPLDKSMQAAGQINNRLTQSQVTRAGTAVDNRGPDAGAYHSTLEVNDFPQKARWAVTNRSNIAKVLDATGTAITTKGIYYPPGKEPGSDDKQAKLYLLVEGDSERVVQHAMNELIALAKQGFEAAANSEARALPSGGRYNV